MRKDMKGLQQEQNKYSLKKVMELREKLWDGYFWRISCIIKMKRTHVVNYHFFTGIHKRLNMLQPVCSRGCVVVERLQK